MSFDHGKSTVFRLDLADGSGPSDVSGLFRSASGLEGKSDRPMTTTFGRTAHRRQVLGLRDGGPISLGGLWQAAAGTKVHGRNTRIMADGFALASYLRNSTLRRNVQLPDTTTYGESWRRRQVVGLMDGGLSINGLFDGAASAIDSILRTMLAASAASNISLGPNGFAIGNLVDLGQMVLNNYSVEGPLEDVVPISADFDSDDRIDLGVSLHDLGAETGVVNFASVDETAVTNLGWVSHLHVTAYSGGGSVTLKLQDSADDAVWADISGGTYTITATGTQRLEGAATAQVRRYVRAIISAFTATSVTFHVNLARRGFTYGSAATMRHLLGLYGLAATSSFEYGPSGSTAGQRKLTGEARLSSLEISYPHDDNLAFTAELTVDGAVTETTW